MKSNACFLYHQLARAALNTKWRWNEVKKVRFINHRYQKLFKFKITNCLWWIMSTKEIRLSSFISLIMELVADILCLTFNALSFTINKNLKVWNSNLFARFHKLVGLVLFVIRKMMISNMVSRFSTILTKYAFYFLSKKKIEKYGRIDFTK